MQVADVLVDPQFEGPTFWFQQLDAPRPQRNSIHIDLYLPEDQAEARIDAAVAAGGRIASDAHAPEWWTLADPEGNEVDVALGRTPANRDALTSDADSGDAPATGPRRWMPRDSFVASACRRDPQLLVSNRRSEW